MKVLGYTGRLVNQNLLPHIPKKHHPLFIFGLTAFTVNPFVSLASNARQVVANVHTAASKVYRLTSNTKLLSNLQALVSYSGLVTRNSLVNVDFSSFCGFETLALGVQTSLGRAIPVWADVLKYPIKEPGSQNLFIIETLKQFRKQLGFWPALVFDRGFVIPILIELLIASGVTFYVRVKSSQGFLPEGVDSKQTAYQMGKTSKDILITAYGTQLRLVVSPPPPAKETVLKPAPKERWYILTNDWDSSRRQVLNIYRCRFEIEETFKDIKHIADLKKFFLKKSLSFKILLQLVMMGFWLAWWSQVLTLGANQVHPKKLRSWFRIWWETIQRQLKSPSYYKWRWQYRLVWDTG